MRSEAIPIIRLEIQPMISAICQHMGVDNSTLAEVIKEEVAAKLGEVISKIPAMVEKEIEKLTVDAINKECDLWVSSKYGELAKDRNWSLTFKTEIRSRVSIAISKWLDELSAKKD